jgi:hypothetical protein
MRIKPFRRCAILIVKLPWVFGEFFQIVAVINDAGVEQRRRFLTCSIRPVAGFFEPQARRYSFRSSLFRHERSLRGKFVSVNSAFASFRRGQQRAAFPVQPAGSWRKSARGLAQSKTLREVRKPLANASVLDCPPSAVMLRRTGGGPPPLSIQGAAWPNQLSGAWKSFFVLPHHDPSWQIKARRNRSQDLGCNSFSNALAAPAEEAGFWPVISRPSVCT